MRACLVAMSAAALLSAPCEAFATPGDLDPGFGGGGTVQTHFSDSVDFANAVAIQADGKIVAVGTQDLSGGFALARFNPDGSLDSAFDGDGKVTTGTVPDGGMSEALDVAIQPSDQKIVVAGYAFGPDGSEDFAVARYNPNGSLDNGFGGGDGTVITQFVGTPDDFTYDNDRAEGVAIQPDGKIVAAGFGDPFTGGTVRDFAVARYQANGTLDNGFGGDGKVTQNIQGTDFGRDLLLQPDGRILVAGSTQPAGPRNSAFVQFEADGDVDPTFSGNGLLAINFGGPSELLGVTLQPDGKIVAVGSTTFEGDVVFLVTRRNGDGSADTSFDSDGNATTRFPGDNDAEWRDVAVQADGTIVGAGFTNGGLGGDFAVGRFRPDGERDSRFSCDGAVRTDFGGEFDDVSGMALDSAGRIVTAGSSGTNFALARYVSDGEGPDCVPPETAIQGPGKSTKRQPKFKLSSNEPGSTFQCKLDNKQKFEPCQAVYKPKRPLARGKHKLFAVATDEAGNTDETPAVQSFKIVEKKN
jgi:uncharacterized delta-60 repeat protein